ncbi:MAG: UDP-glucose 4-epimerase GalE [Candidatus Kuenenia stuttgartiensis]|nr:UDP-glucose 4-epimerase GalE [Candidatus Kuenenia stuttgartiensis]
MSKNILVPGGAGYVGSHMVYALLHEGYNPVVFDNLSTGCRESIPDDVIFIEADLRNASDIMAVLKCHRIDAVMHFAASSIAPESMVDPLKYYENNVLACVNLLKAMAENKVKKFIFSSTAAVYGEPVNIPVKEEDETLPTNTYGRSKLMIENILRDIAVAHDFSYISLRYFNAAGAHPSGRTGEKHNPETHLIPNILKVASGEKDELTIFGDDYPTPDGTCIRDYIHIQDLCRAHLLALEALNGGVKSDMFNLGSGSGYSVKQILQTAEEITGSKIKTKTASRRTGDPARLVASSGKAQKILGWKPELDIREIIQSAWAWECKTAALKQKK